MQSMRCSTLQRTCGGVVKSNSQSKHTTNPLQHGIDSAPSSHRYFSHSSQLSVSSWTTDETGALDPCGHCDNCTRPPETLDSRDVTLATWQILRIVEAVRQSGTKLTLSQLVVLARGGKKGTFEVKKGRKKEQSTLDLDGVAGGAVEMSKLVRVFCVLLFRQA